MTLERFGIKAPRPKPRPAKYEDVEPLYNTFQRARKVLALPERFSNVRLKWLNAQPKTPGEWVYVMELHKYGSEYELGVYALRTTDKGKAVRRAYGWGLRDQDGNPVWPPEPDIDGPDEPHFPDVDEAAYFHYWRF